MSEVTIVLTTDDDSSFDLRGDPADVAENVADIAEPLLAALSEVYSPATLAVVLDMAAEIARSTATDAAPTPDAVRVLAGIMREQRAMRAAVLDLN